MQSRRLVARLFPSLLCLSLLLLSAPTVLYAQQLPPDAVTPEPSDTPPATVEFSLTEQGVVPAQFTVVAGAQVSWVNNTSQPLQLSSQPFVIDSPTVYLPLVSGPDGQANTGVAAASADEATETVWTSDPIAPGGRFNRAYLSVGSFAFFTNNQGGNAGQVNVVASVARIEVTPGAALLTTLGQSTTLSAAAFDSSGAPVFAPIVWSSSNPAQVSVDAGGKVTAMVSTGSGLVYASFGAITSLPGTILVATPSPAANLIYDTEVVQKPVAVMPSSEPGLGTQYRTVLQGTDLPIAGELIVGAEGSAILGRVLSVVSSGANAEVTYETVALTDVFEDLMVDEHIELRQAPLLMDAFAASGATVEQSDNGNIIVRFEGESTNVRAAGPDQIAFDLGPFTCDASAGFGLQGSLIEVKFENNMGLDFAVSINDWTLQRLLVQLEGSLKSTISGGLDLTVAATGKVSCRIQRIAAWIPIGGPLSTVITPVIPIGAGFDIDGQLKLARLQIELIGEVEIKAKFGFDWHPGSGTNLVNDFDMVNNSRFDTNMPNLLTDFGFKGHIFSYALTGVGVSAFPDNVAGKITWNIIDLKGGPQQNMDLLTPLGQASDDYYASDYDLTLKGKAGIGPDLQKLFDLIKGAPAPVDMPKVLSLSSEVNLVLAESPHGTLTTDKTSAAWGQPVNLTVALDPTDLTYPLLFYNVQAVRLYRLRNGQLQLLATLPAIVNQEQFTWQWLPSSSDVGPNHLVAFVVSRALAFLPLEIGDNSGVDVSVQSAQPTPTLTPISTSAPTSTPTPTPSPTPQPSVTPQVPIQIVEDFSQTAVGTVPAGWSVMGSGQFIPTVQESGGSGPAYHVLDFPEVGWQYWDKWAIRNGTITADVYTVQVKLRFLNDVADRAGLTLAMDRDTLQRIDIHPNVYTNQIEFRSSFGGTVNNLVAGIAIDSGANYWLRAIAENLGPNAGKVSVYWSANGTTFTKVLEATGLSNVAGEVGVSTAGPHMPHTQFDDFTLTLAAGPLASMILIPAGPFQMGCETSDDPLCDNYIRGETPRHTVNLSAYAIDTYEVTNARYAACLDAGSCTAPHSNQAYSIVRGYVDYEYYGVEQYANFPVVNVDWNQATAFCAWDGKRLPTEAEWEKAARGSSDTRIYPWGNSIPDCTLGNFHIATTGYDCVGETAAVGSYPTGASPYGVMDMSGNVWEWVNDWWDGGYYATSPVNDPQGSASIYKRGSRGGSWLYGFDIVRASFRDFDYPDYWYFDSGFRCVRSQ